MKDFRWIPFPLTVSIIISGILHAAAFAVIPGIDVLGPAGLFAGKAFLADLVTEPAAARVKARVRTYAPPSDRPPSGVSPEKGAAVGKGREEVRQRAPQDSEVNGSAVMHGADEASAVVEDRGKMKEGEGTAVAKNLIKAVGALPAKSDETRKIINFTRERFSYDIYWIGIYVGKAVLEAVDDNGTITITSRVRSAPFISTFYKVEDFAESRVRNGMPFNFRIRQREGRYRSDKETIFDADGGRITYFDYLKDLKEEHVRESGVFWDVMSGFYYLRTRPMSTDKTVFVDIFDSNNFFSAEVNVLGREKIGVAGKGEVEAIVVRPILKSDGLFQNKGDIRIWLSNDENRFPLRVETKVPIGNVVAELKEVETER